MKKFNKKRKQILCILFSSILVMLSAITAFASGDTIPTNDYAAQSEINKDLITLLTNNGIKASVINNKVVLNDLTDINKANKVLTQDFSIKSRLNTRAITSYPTQYYGPFAKYYYNKKFQKAAKTALATTITAWAGGVKVPQALVGTFVSAYFSYWFVESDTVNVYTSVLYYYRENGPGRFDSWGNFIGDYRIKKVTRITTNSDYSGGKTKTEYSDQSQLIEF